MRRCRLGGTGCRSRMGCVVWRVGLCARAEVFEGCVGGGELRFAGVLGDDEGGGAEGCPATIAPEEAEGGFVLGCSLVGWVEVDDVERRGEPGEALQHRPSA